MTNKPDDFDCWRMPDDGSREKVVVIKDTKAVSYTHLTLPTILLV